MAKTLVLLLGLGLCAFIFKNSHGVNKRIPQRDSVKTTLEDHTLRRLNMKAGELRQYATKNNFSAKTAFLIDMSLPRGRKRFFVYDLEKDSVVNSGLVAHGSCNTDFLETALFSNVTGCGCTSQGKYKISYPYQGNFGRSFKLKGLDPSNSKAFERFIVLHSYKCVPDEETFPDPICNSRGCPMVSPAFMKDITRVIERSGKPLLLYIYK